MLYWLNSDYSKFKFILNEFKVFVHKQFSISLNFYLAMAIVSSELAICWHKSVLKSFPKMVGLIRIVFNFNNLDEIVNNILVLIKSGEGSSYL